VQDHLAGGIEHAHRTLVCWFGLAYRQSLRGNAVTPHPCGTEREAPSALLRRRPIAAFACAARDELLQRSCANRFPRFWCNGTTDRGSTSYNLHFGAVKYESIQRAPSPHVAKGVPSGA